MRTLIILFYCIYDFNIQIIWGYLCILLPVLVALPGWLVPGSVWSEYRCLNHDRQERWLIFSVWWSPIKSSFVQLSGWFFLFFFFFSYISTWVALLVRVIYQETVFHSEQKQGTSFWGMISVSKMTTHVHLSCPREINSFMQKVTSN